MEALAKLKPGFRKDGTVTAGNAPGVNDGAAAVVVTSAKRAKELDREPMVRIVAQATSGVEPKWVMMAPVGAVRQIWEKTGWKNQDVDLYELNEAFSVQALGVMRELGLDPNRVNVNGGAVALGHPIGASGARVLVTLIYEMIRRNARRGIAALCLGGGNAVAMAVERLMICRASSGFGPPTLAASGGATEFLILRGTLHPWRPGFSRVDFLTASSTFVT